MIPEEIRNLIHLRYLKIVGFNLTMLPRSLSNLYHLQYIIYDSPEELKRLHKVDYFLPSDINSLPNLRCMKLPKSCSSLIRWIGNLKSHPEQVVSGYRSIGEMKNMNDLCILEINRLECVDAEEARNAQLCEKTRLTDLTLCWRRPNSRNIALYENVLDKLHPPNCVRNLSIWRYMGARSAIWMNNVKLIFNLEKIELKDCSEWETLPPFGQLPFLKSLILENMPKVKWLESKFNRNDKHHAFPLLEVLRIEKLKALEGWFEAGVAAENGCLFPSTGAICRSYASGITEPSPLFAKSTYCELSSRIEGALSGGWRLRSAQDCSHSSYLYSSLIIARVKGALSRGWRLRSAQDCSHSLYPYISNLICLIYMKCEECNVSMNKPVSIT